MSMSVVVRLWMYSTTPEDITFLTDVISDVINLHRSATLQYRSDHPVHRDIFTQISSGFHNLHGKFFTTFVSRMLWLSIEHLPKHMELLLHMYHIGHNSHSPTYAAFINIAFHCHTLWSNSFSLLRLLAQRGEQFDDNCHRVAQAIIGNAAFCIHNAQSEHHQCEQLLQDWVSSDIFGAIDDILSACLRSIYFTGPSYTSVFFHLANTISSSIRTRITWITSTRTQAPSVRAFTSFKTIPSRSHSTCYHKLGEIRQDTPAWYIS